MTLKQRKGENSVRGTQEPSVCVELMQMLSRKLLLSGQTGLRSGEKYFKVKKYCIIVARYQVVPRGNVYCLRLAVTRDSDVFAQLCYCYWQWIFATGRNMCPLSTYCLSVSRPNSMLLWDAGAGVCNIYFSDSLARNYWLPFRFC